MLALQRRVGNDAVRTLAEGRVVLQRQEAPVAAGADPAVQAAAERVWENEVSYPIAEAYNDLAGPRPDYGGAHAALWRATASVRAAMDPLPKGDPRVVDGNYVVDDLRRGLLYLEAKLRTVTDQDVAEFLKFVYNEAETFGQKLGVVTEPSVLASEVVVTP
jgi:hypothetical protein